MQWATPETTGNQEILVQLLWSKLKHCLRPEERGPAWKSELLIPLGSRTGLLSYFKSFKFLNLLNLILNLLPSLCFFLPCNANCKLI